MRNHLTIALGLALLTGCQQPPLTIEQYEARIELLGAPAFDMARQHEPGYMASFRDAQHELNQQKAALLLEAARAHPQDLRIPDLLNRRWMLLTQDQEPDAIGEAVLEDIAAVTTEFDHPVVARHAAYWRTLIEAHQAAGVPDGDAMTAAVVGFVTEHPTDQRGASLLYQIANHPSASPANTREAWQQIADVYPQTYWGPYAPGQVRRLTDFRQPVELEFEELRSGERISTETLAGKVVVLDFWATTCAPCVAALPEMHRVYAEYKDRGVEFVGVSLDVPESRGGRQALDRFLAEYEVPWPIYYQGNGYSSDFSISWGVGGIPEVFLLDQEGRLVETNARGRLAELIPEYL
jgi:thiol-disulfide isomerase/thioredoxin